ncbi:hypothetical protein L7F22_031607 [Adiantum nelumboides]|nr:hypothetical protein [Adiantum nelumboides]
MYKGHEEEYPKCQILVKIQIGIQIKTKMQMQIQILTVLEIPQWMLRKAKDIAANDEVIFGNADGAKFYHGNCQAIFQVGSQADDVNMEVEDVQQNANLMSKYAQHAKWILENFFFCRRGLLSKFVEIRIDDDFEQVYDLEECHWQISNANSYLESDEDAYVDSDTELNAVKSGAAEKERNVASGVEVVVGIQDLQKDLKSENQIAKLQTEFGLPIWNVWKKRLWRQMQKELLGGRLLDQGIMGPSQPMTSHRSVPGHIVSTAGVQMDPAKIEAIRNRPDLKNTHEVRSFLGLCSYYRWYVRKFAEIASPLHMLTQKGVPFSWGVTEVTASQTLKDKMTTGPVLILPDLQKSFEKQLSEKQMRWANILSQFQFQIVHVLGQKNVVADALSRKPLVQAISAICHSTFEDMIDQYATDPDFADIFTRIRDGETVAGYSLREGYLMRKTMLCVTQPL